MGVGVRVCMRRYHRYGVVYGQHRVGALRELLGRGEWRDGQRVLMEVLPLPNDNAVVFLNIDTCDIFFLITIPNNVFQVLSVILSLWYEVDFNFAFFIHSIVILFIQGGRALHRHQQGGASERRRFAWSSFHGSARHFGELSVGSAHRLPRNVQGERIVCTGLTRKSSTLPLASYALVGMLPFSLLRTFVMPMMN